MVGWARLELATNPERFRGCSTIELPAFELPEVVGGQLRILLRLHFPFYSASFLKCRILHTDNQFQRLFQALCGVRMAPVVLLQTSQQIGRRTDVMATTTTA